MKDEMSPEVFDALEALFDSEARIVGFDERTSDTISESFVNRRVILSNISSITRKIRYYENCIWFYVPYNTITNDGRENRFLEDLFNCFKSDEFSEDVDFDVFEKKFIDTGNCLRDLFTDNKGNVDDTKYNSFINKLKELYKKASSPMKGVTAINLNSLNLLSFGSPLLKENANHTLHYSKDYYEIMKRKFLFFQWNGKENSPYKIFMKEIRKKDYYNFNMSYCSFSGLYTGDCMMEYNFFEHIDRICNEVIESPIGLLQIPHHGSKYNYNQLILSKPILSSFINFNSTRKASNDVKEIERDFFMVCKPCFEITQDEESCFEQQVFWDSSIFNKKKNIHS